MNETIETAVELAAPHLSRRALTLLLVALLCVGVLYVKTVGITTQAYQLSQESAVQTWSLRLPGRYRLEYWRYTPASAEGGLRLLQD